jgi:hypothetical protein
VIFQLIAGWFSKYITTFFALVLIMREFKLDKVINSNIFLSTAAGVIYIASYMISRNLFTLFKFLNIYVYICAAVLFFGTLAAFTVFNIKSGKNMSGN